MAMTTKLVADGNIELMFLQQMGRDPFVPKPERTAQVVEVASRIARFIGEAATSIDIAIYDWRLHDEPAAIEELLRSHVGPAALQTLRVYHAELQVRMRVQGESKNYRVRLAISFKYESSD